MSSTKNVASVLRPKQSPILPERSVPFSRPPRAAREEATIAEVLRSGALVGGGVMTRRAQSMLEEITGARKVLLTNSGTAALEMACLLLNLGAGDEVIVPSFTFASCANAIALRGAVPVFVDVRADTLNLDEELVEAAITSRTRALMPVHYAGVAAEMATLAGIADRYGLSVIEDAAQGIGARYRGRALGAIGTLGTFSFHGSKNISAGEGGALLVNDESLVERAEILWEKGTNRSRFIRGEVDKYTWIDVGSSFLPSELTAALLASQLAELDSITDRRRAAWDRYQTALADLEAVGIGHPIIPQDRDPNGHIYYVMMPTTEARDRALTELRARGVQAAFHYIPLHSAPAGRRFGRTHGNLRVTDDLSSRLLRLPLYADIDPADQDYVIASLREVVREIGAVDA
jgi:dTDP-4-amino-4,6-dideoxygalactose transaminase